MSRELGGITEKLEIRPKKKIQADLQNIDGEWEAIDGEVELVNDSIEKLPESQRKRYYELYERFGEGEIEDDEIRRDFPKKTAKLVMRARDITGVAIALGDRQEALLQEYTPYRREELEQVVRDLSARVDYDSVFEHYLKRGWGDKDGSDLISNTAFEIFILGKYQYQLVSDTDGKDYHYYDFGQKTLDKFRETWGEKGFLKKEPEEDYEISSQSGAETAEERKQLVKEMGEELERLEVYRRLVAIYRRERIYPSYDDFKLSDIQRVLDVEKNGRGNYVNNGFEEVDFPPEFIAAAKKHIERELGRYREVGWLSQTAEILAREQQRVDALDRKEPFNTVRQEGFEAPEGMKMVFTAEEVFAEVQEVLPPDFTRGLLEFSRKDGPGQSSENDPTIETIGRFFTVFGKKRQVVGSKIEVYRDPFVAEGADEVEIATVRNSFMEVTWHEFGHNAQNMLTLDEMLGWEEVMEQDGVAVTWYVRHSREDNEDRGKREDFCESAKMLLSNPALLFILSKNRYIFMRNFFIRRLQTSQKEAFCQRLTESEQNTFEIWREAGYSPDKIRENYLSHELE